MAETTTRRKALVIEIDLEGAAFDGFPDSEVAAILRTLAAKVERGALNHNGEALADGYGTLISDSNGNAVGSAEVVIR